MAVSDVRYCSMLVRRTKCGARNTMGCLSCEIGRKQFEERSSDPTVTCPRCGTQFEGIGRHCRDCVMALHREAQQRGPVVIL